MVNQTDQPASIRRPRAHSPHSNPDPTSDRQVRNLFDAIESSRRVLRCHREKRMEYLTQFVGYHYGEKGSKERVPVNYLHMATSLYVRTMAARVPTVMVDSEFVSLRPVAANLQLLTQRALDKMKIDEAIEEIVTEAIFGMGIAKVGLKRSPDGPKADVGVNYCEPVDFDDWVHDTSVKRWSQIEFEGDRYALSVSDLLADPLIDPDVVLDLPVKHRTNTNSDEERSESLSRGSSFADEEGLEDQIELWDLWLPRDNLIITLDAQTGRLLKAVENDSLRQGPYHKLWFGKVPGNLMPSAPASLLMDLHLLANQLFVKNMRAATKFKKVVVTPPEALKDGELIRTSDDLEYIVTAQADKVKEIAFHGAAPETIAMYLEARNEANRFGGNLDALGGLGPQSETLGQDTLITGAANERLQWMNEKKDRCVTGIVRHIAWNLYTDPVTTYNVPKRIPGTDMQIAISFTPEQRSGDFLEFNFNIQAFSMAARGPMQQLQNLRTYCTEFLFPAYPLIQAQGGTINIEAILKEAGEKLFVGKLDQLVEFPGDAPPRGPDLMDGMSKPPVTTRNYVRTNRSGATSQQRDHAMSNALMGIRTNSSSRSAAARTPS